MPHEAAQLDTQPAPLTRCPVCGAYPFVPFLRGLVQRAKRRWWVGPRQDYCAVLCRGCFAHVGWESPPVDRRLP